MLVLDSVDVSYGGAPVLRGVSLRVDAGQVLCLVGRNGAGKTTTLKAIMGLVRPSRGRIALDGADLTTLRPHAVPRLGVAYVPQGRRLFPSLTVEENLRMGLLARAEGSGTFEAVLDLFPALRPRLRQRAGTLSGGEQQMTATARALCADPRILLMDEPTEGLAPQLVGTLLETIRALRARGVGVLLVEQRIDAALRVADAVAVMETGRIQYQAPAEDLARDPSVLVHYLGVTRAG